MTSPQMALRKLPELLTSLSSPLQTTTPALVPPVLMVAEHPIKSYLRMFQYASCISSFCFVLFCFVLFCFVLFCFVLFCFVLFCFVLFCFVLFCIVLYCIVLYCIVLYCIVLYCITNIII